MAKLEQRTRSLCWLSPAGLNPEDDPVVKNPQYCILLPPHPNPLMTPLRVPQVFAVPAVQHRRACERPLEVGSFLTASSRSEDASLPPVMKQHSSNFSRHQGAFCRHNGPVLLHTQAGRGDMGDHVTPRSRPIRCSASYNPCSPHLLVISISFHPPPPPVRKEDINEH